MVTTVTGGGGEAVKNQTFLRSKRGKGIFSWFPKDTFHLCACAVQRGKPVCFVPPGAKSRGNGVKQKHELRFPRSKEDEMHKT